MKRFRDLSLAVVVSVGAQAEEGPWRMGLQAFPASLEGWFRGTVDGQPLDLDLKRDLALGRDRIWPGIHLEYNGHRFAFALASEGQDYKGSALLTRQVTLDGVTYQVGSQVDSKVKVRSYDLNATLKLYTWEQAWIGLDLGAHVWDLDLGLRGDVNGTPESAAEEVAVPIPQAGISVGGHLFGGRLEGLSSFHFLSYKGASYRRWQGDLRYYPLPWLGLRAFLDSEHLDVPKDSLQDDLVLKVDRQGAGFGVVFRF